MSEGLGSEVSAVSPAEPCSTIKQVESLHLSTDLRRGTKSENSDCVPSSSCVSDPHTLQAKISSSSPEDSEINQDGVLNEASSASEQQQQPSLQSSTSSSNLKSKSKTEVEEEEARDTPSVSESDSDRDKREGNKQDCSFFVKSGWCRFGQNCRYLHPKKEASATKASATKASSKDTKGPSRSSRENEEKAQSVEAREVATNSTGDADAPLTNDKLSASSKAACKFFARAGWCRYGYRCRFAHVKEKSARESDAAAESESWKQDVSASDFGDDGEAGRSRSIGDATVSGNASQSTSRKTKVCRFYARSGICRLGTRCRFLHESTGEVKSDEHQDEAESVKEDEGDWRPVRKPVMPSSILSRPLADIKDGDAAQMRETEISQLRKRFPGDKLVVGTETDIPVTYRFTVTPTDPDWPYDLKEFEVEVIFPEAYPIDQIQLSLPEDQVLPSVILRHMLEATTEWLQARYDTNQLSGRVELTVRPFLRWFDRNLMRLFTEGARKFKKEVYAKAAGFEFISYAKPEEEDVARQPTDRDDEAPVYPKGRFINQEIDGQEDEDDEEEDEEEDDDDEYDEYDDKVEMNISGLSARSQGATASQNDASGGIRSRYESPTENRRGTEIRLPQLVMSESAATLVCLKIKLRVQCARCREQTDLSVVPGLALVLGCHKCQSQQVIGFRPCLLHQFSSVLGFLDLTGCAPVDLIVYECNFTVTCLDCSEETNIQGIQYGQKRLVWCSKCNQKMSVAMEPAKFQKLVASVPEGKATVVSVKKDKRVRDPAIKEGFPLPDNGTCKHYKKSFRWLRFPCCGKVYPCDECHDLAETDHEMVFAVRMICGHCSKEQHFSVDKPCIGCGSSTTKARTIHWEGGTGCRNRNKMSKTDKQKYTGFAKTTSRKAQKAEDAKKGKKKK